MQGTLPADQQHLLAHRDQLDTPGREALDAQLAKIDFDLMQSLFQGQEKSTDWAEVAGRAVPPPAFRVGDDNCRFTPEQARDAGEAALRAGQLGVIVVAGGQGSRLGFEHPKGMFPIGPLSDRTLFQIHIEQLRSLGQRYGVSIPLYLMTSPATHDETVAFLNEHDRFGLAENDLHIFCQGTMPAVDAQTGQLLLAAPGKVFESPDGHGGTLAALANNGCLADMQQRGIKQLFYFQVDNPLIDMCQSELVGYHVLSQSELTTQVIGKEDPLEKVGNVVMVDGQMTVIEYSDLPDEQADRRDEQGQPIFWAGSIAVHVFDVGFLQRAADSPDALPFHRALKKVPYVDQDGQSVTPDQPNAIKFEKFIFDLLPSAKNPIVVEARACDVFSPLKNASGAAKDTPETTRAALVAKHRRLLADAGIQVPDHVRVEVNSLFASTPAEVKQRLGETTEVYTDTYFAAPEAS